MPPHTASRFARIVPVIPARPPIWDRRARGVQRRDRFRGTTLHRRTRRPPRNTTETSGAIGARYRVGAELPPAPLTSLAVGLAGDSQAIRALDRHLGRRPGRLRWTFFSPRSVLRTRRAAQDHRDPAARYRPHLDPGTEKKPAVAPWFSATGTSSLRFPLLGGRCSRDRACRQ